MPTATGRPFAARVFSILRISSLSRNLTPYVRDAPAARVTEVGVFQGCACFHSFSAYAWLWTIQSKNPSNVVPRGVGSVKIGPAAALPAGPRLGGRIGLYASNGVFPSGTT